jgi:hypothetical protein
VQAEASPAEPRPLDSARLFAVLGTWMEEDVVAATVANCFAQGCERVYLVDNESPDRTVERAVAAGATLATTFPSELYDEGERVRQMRRVADAVSSSERAGHIWWLFLDADEFYHGPRGLTLRDYLAGLDRRFRVVGARFFNHLPGGGPAYVEARHPLDFQPLCYEVRAPYCDRGHWRHPLVRWDRDSPALVPDEGFHTSACSDLLIEPAEAVFFHHFPFRAEADTRRRLSTLFGGATPTSTRVPAGAHVVHLQRRLRSLDAVYRQRWAEMPVHPPCAPGYVPDLRPWEEWVEPADRDVARWY